MDMDMDREVPILFKDKSDCCACGACLNICPKKAINMKEDEYGFLYPHIREEICVRCGKCKSVCAFQNTEVKNSPIEIYAAVAKDDEIRKNSASGGIFATLANRIIDRGGIAIGAELQADFSVCHVIIDSVNKICKLQNSKYTQSSTGRTFEEVKKHLEEGRKVLFSGTPCQVAGLYGFLGTDYEQLITVDIVCHGVPNNKMLQDYIKVLEDKNSGKVTKFTFRDKSIGWGKNGSAVINGKKKKIWQSASSYFYYFTKGWLFRENCYKCKYTSSHRPADITLGDYWGIEKQHPEYLGKNRLDESMGISVVIANTEKGCSYLRGAEGLIESRDSSFEKAAAGNGQLKHPSQPGMRDEILRIYETDGWAGLERRFEKNIGWRKYSSFLKNLVPVWLKSKLKALNK